MNIKKLINKAKNTAIPVAERAEALLLLGDAFRTGKHAKKDVIRAFKYYFKAATMGSRDAMYVVAQSYRNGIGTRANKAQAFYWHSKAANLGDSDSMAVLGDYYSTGYGVEKNEETGFEWYIQAVESGNEKAVRNLAICYYYGLGTKQDIDKAVEQYTKLAEKSDDTSAMIFLADYYLYDCDMPYSGQKAYYWYQQAADVEHYAQSQLADCRFFGIGTERDVQAAIEYWQEEVKDFNNPDTKATHRLAYCLYNGIGIAKDIKKAEEIICGVPEPFMYLSQTAKMLIKNGNYKTLYDFLIYYKKNATDDMKTTALLVMSWIAQKIATTDYRRAMDCCRRPMVAFSTLNNMDENELLRMVESEEEQMIYEE